MDADDIFKKLSYGAVFSKPLQKSIKHQFQKESVDNIKKAEHNQQTTRSKIKTKKTDNVEAKTTENATIKAEENGDSVSEDSASEDITLLGNMKSAGKPSSKKRQKKSEKLSNKKQKLIETEQINHIRNKNHINVSGNNVPTPTETFVSLSARYSVSEKLLKNIENCGYKSPTPIQMQAIPAMLENHQILACAPTGSGKTAAFLIPIIHHLRTPKQDGFRALIVSPTRELSRQTYRVCERLCEGTKLRIHITTKIKDTTKKSAPDSSHKFDILITTPNRLVYLLNQEPPTMSLKNVEWLVVDESDKLFETGVRGFRDQLAVIYQACDSNNVKRAMFSATYTTEVAKWSKKNLKDLIVVTIGQRNTTVESVEQELIYAGNEEGKLIAMRDLIRKGISPPVLIFLQSKERARDLFKELLYDGINVEVIHSDRTQLQRDNVVKAFREGKIWVLICTELMGRGIDFKGVNLVINYDFPPTAISYIHRIGRTGRAGRKGRAVTFFTDNDIPYLKSVVNVMKESGCEIPEFLTTLKKPHKTVRRKLETKLPARESVATKPHRYKSLIEKQNKVEKENSKTEGKSSVVVKRKKDSNNEKTPEVKKRKKFVRA